MLRNMSETVGRAFHYTPRMLPRKAHLNGGKSSPIFIRPATYEDVPGMTDVFFESFNQKFWQYFCPDQVKNREWIFEMWARGINTPTDRSFVAIDMAKANLVVGFARWQVPQRDGSQNHDAWPEPTMLDQHIARPFFGGMDDNRAEIMKGKPHWYLDMMGIREAYQGQGIAQELIEWGLQQADRNGREVFLHGTEAGQGFYEKKYGFKFAKWIPVPDHPAYGSYKYMSMVRPVQKSKTEE